MNRKKLSVIFFVGFAIISGCGKSVSEIKDSNLVENDTLEGDITFSTEETSGDSNEGFVQMSADELLDRFVNALYKAYVDVTGDTEHEPMVIGGGTYAKSLKNIIAFGPEKLGMDYHIHSADEFILVSEMEEAVLIYMEAIKNLLAI
jgi:acetylornithine deacetylase/succinyl-diaminopimelate desuccinylase-like protein